MEDAICLRCGYLVPTSRQWQRGELVKQLVKLSVCCQTPVTHTQSKASINTPRLLPGLYALNAHVLIADGHVRSQVEPLKMWPGAKGHPLMSKSFFPPFVGREEVRKCAH